MSQLKLVEFTNPDVLSTYASVLALIESTKNDIVPFNPNIITKLLVSFEDHLKSISPKTMPVPDFKNMLYILIEEQVSSGFIISPSLKNIINNHRITMNKNPMNLQLQAFLIHSAKLD
jgi:hypothetical protein